MSVYQEYKILRATQREQNMLEQEVTQHLHDGWHLHGNLNVYVLEQTVFFAQAMYYGRVPDGSGDK